jgi:hypothetical protein
MDLDDVIPGPHYQICHSRVARAPLPAVWDALHRVTMSALPLGRALEGMRVLPARLAGQKPGPLAAAAFSTSLPFRCCSPSDPMSLSQQASARPGACWEDRYRRIWTRRPCARGPNLDGSRPGWNFASNRSRQEPF